MPVTTESARRISLPLAGAALVVTAVFGVFAYVRHDTDTYRVPPDTSVPGLRVGEKVTVNHDAYVARRPRGDDIVLYRRASRLAIGTVLARTRGAYEVTGARASSIYRRVWSVDRDDILGRVDDCSFFDVRCSARR